MLGEILGGHKEFDFSFPGDKEPKTIFVLKYPGKARELLYWTELGDCDSPNGMMTPQQRTDAKVELMRNFLLEGIQGLKNLHKKGDEVKDKNEIKELLDALSWQRFQSLVFGLMYGKSRSDQADEAGREAVATTAKQEAELKNVLS